MSVTDIRGCDITAICHINETKCNCMQRETSMRKQDERDLYFHKTMRRKGRRDKCIYYVVYFSA
jgi:hypothetical protein